MGNWKVLVPNAEQTNLCTNPSAETGTTGWSTGGTNTLAQDSWGYKGEKSFKVTYANSKILLTQSFSFPTANRTYWLSCWVYADPTNAIGELFIEPGEYIGATVTYEKQQGGIDSRWVRLVTKIQVTTDLDGTIEIKTAETVTGTPIVWLDAIMYVQDAQDQSYIDGDQPGCYWNATPHAGTSVRPINSGPGGEILDLEDDLGFYIEQMEGVGLPPIRNVARNRALIDGAEFERTIANSRIFRLTARIVGSSLSNLHALRKAFIEAVRPDPQGGAQPIALRYYGEDINTFKEILVRYDSGLMFSKGGGFSELAGLQFIAHEPFFYTGSDNPTTVTPYINQNMEFIFAKEDGKWKSFGLAGTTGGSVEAIEKGPDGKIYVGGNFTSWGGVAGRDYIARWDITTATWETVGSSSDLNGTVTVLKTGPDGLLYVGGTFTNAGGDLSADYFASFDPSTSTWADVENTSGGTVTSVNAIEFANNEMYVGGDFVNWAGGANNDYIARLTPAAGWSNMGTISAGDIVETIAIGPDKSVWVGGKFDDFGGVSAADGIAKWSGGAWSGPNSSIGTTGDTIHKLLIDQKNGDIYAFGDFSTANGGTSNFEKAARYDGNVWHRMEGWKSTGTLFDAVWLSDDRILACGDVSLVRMDAAIGVWNGSAWNNVGMSNLITSPTAHDLTSLYADFTRGGWYVGMSDDLTLQNGDRVVITNGGTAKAYPTFKLSSTGAGSTGVTLFWISNETTGAELYFDYNLNDDEVLTINLTPGSRSAESSLYGKVWPFLSGSNITDFSIVPGSNYLLVYAGTGGSPTVNLSIKFNEQYWSVD